MCNKIKNNNDKNKYSKSITKTNSSITNYLFDLTKIAKLNKKT